MLKALFKKAARTPVLGRVILIPYRLFDALRYYYLPSKEVIRWLVRSREFTNYTYSLTPANKKYLAAFIADLTEITFETAQSYIDEIDHDQELKSHIQRTISRSVEGRFADKDVKFGRRIGWYAIVRAVKPRVVVETGVDKGLGSCVLTAAIMRNKIDGYDGYYIGTDINPSAGFLLEGEYANHGKILYGDSIESLSKLEDKIDLFINDSDHSDEYERMEYDIIRDKLKETAIVIGDNAHSTDALFDFARETGRSFLFFKEQPENHWYPGEGIGVAFRRSG